MNRALRARIYWARRFAQGSITVDAPAGGSETRGYPLARHAPIIATPADPLEDIQTLKRVSFVMKDGVVFKNASEARP